MLTLLKVRNLDTKDAIHLNILTGIIALVPSTRTNIQNRGSIPKKKKAG
jgi:hypothetical protein